MYRSVTPSKRNSGLRKTLTRVEGLMIGIALFLAVFYLLGYSPVQRARPDMTASDALAAVTLIRHK